jgi:hypothetical protein
MYPPFVQKYAERGPRNRNVRINQELFFLLYHSNLLDAFAEKILRVRLFIHFISFNFPAAHVFICNCT